MLDLLVRCLRVTMQAFPWITYADLWTLAGAQAIEEMGGACCSACALHLTCSAGAAGLTALAPAEPQLQRGNDSCTSAEHASGQTQGCSAALTAAQADLNCNAGPHINWRPGRSDQLDGEKCPPDGRLPDVRPPARCSVSLHSLPAAAAAAAAAGLCAALLRQPAGSCLDPDALSAGL